MKSPSSRNLKAPPPSSMTFTESFDWASPLPPRPPKVNSSPRPPPLSLIEVASRTAPRLGAKVMSTKVRSFVSARLPRVSSTWPPCVPPLVGPVYEKVPASRAALMVTLAAGWTAGRVTMIGISNWFVPAIWTTSREVSSVIVQLPEEVESCTPSTPVSKSANSGPRSVTEPGSSTKPLGTFSAAVLGKVTVIVAGRFWPRLISWRKVGCVDALLSAAVTVTASGVPLVPCCRCQDWSTNLYWTPTVDLVGVDSVTSSL